MQTMLCTLIILIASSCSSLPSHSIYSCSKPSNWGKAKARLCYERGKESKYGLAYPNEDKWYVKPKYHSIVLVDDSLYLQEKENESFVKTNIHLENKRETDFINYFHARGDVNNKLKKLYFVTKNDEIIFFSKMDKRIKNVDRGYLPTEYGTKKSSVYTGVIEGYIVRHRLNNEVYYSIYDYKSELIKDKIPLDKIKFWYNSQYEDDQVGYVIPMIQVDKERDLYWPLIWYNQAFIEKPDHVLGVENTSTRMWLEPDFNIGDRPIALRALGITDLYIVFKDKKGREKFSSHKLNITSRSRNLREFKRIFLEPEKGNILDSLHQVDSVYVATDGKVYNQKYFIEEKNNKFKVSKYLIKKEFNSLAEANSFFDHYQNNKTEIARIYKDKYDKDALETILRDRERARMVEHDRLKLVNEQQAKKAAKKAAIKAESDAAWSNVSDQLKQRAREADQKADCVRGRTKKKQDFLDKKQNWYQDYDC